MAIQFRKKILHKITIVAFFSTLLPLLLNAGYTYITTKGEFERSLKKESIVVSRQLALSIISPLWNMNDKDVIDIIMSRFLSEEVYCIHVVSPKDSSIMYGVERDSSWQPVARKNSVKKKSYSATAPVEKDGDVQGIVKVYMSDKLVKKRLSVLLQNIILSTIFLNIILISALFLFMRAVVVRPVMSIMEGLREISEGEGDLTKRLKISSDDELGSLATYFNQFISSLQQMIKSISLQASTVTQSSHKLSDFSNEIAGESQTVASRVGTVGATSNEMNVKMQEITNIIGNANSSAKTVSTSIEEMSSTIREIASNAEKSCITTEKAVSLANVASEQIETLKLATRGIENVTGIIRDISGKTNLLALNATIEAATAGQAGKGFAVVASEIKDLSRKTAEATNDIADKINNIQSATTSMFEYSQKIFDIIDEVNIYVRNIAASIEEQSVISDGILKNAIQISENIQGVVTTVGSTSKHTKEITSEMHNVTGSVSNLADKNNNILTSVDSLLALSRTLSELVKRFRIE
jgi:methyl-accepting chemotaxis protein